MAIQSSLLNSGNKICSVTKSVGRYSILEYTHDASVTKSTAQIEFFAGRMNVRKRQLVARLNNDGGMILQAGAMQMMLGAVDVTTDIKGAGDLVKKAFSGKVTGESAIKPKYTGCGTVITEPTYKHLLLLDINKLGPMTLEDGLFLACDDSIALRTVSRSNLSSAALGGEGLFNLSLQGNGIAVLESPVPMEELNILTLDNDIVKIDGNFAIAWSSSLKFTVERTTKTLIGSAASGEGLVNVYRGTGCIMVAPVAKGNSIVAE